MTYSPYEPAPPDRGDSWSMNLPIAIGVVFVFLIGVIAWVIIDNSGDDGGDSLTIGTDAGGVTTTIAGTGPLVTTTDPNADPAVSSTTTPAPLPSMPAVNPDTTGVATTVSLAPTTVVATPTPTGAPTPTSTGAPSTVAATTSTVATTGSTEPADTGPIGDGTGDLGIDGAPMATPVCAGEYVTILASAYGDQVTADSIGNVLEEFPDATYVRTDQACRSLNPAVDGEPLYIVYFGPFAFESDACAARADGHDGAYVRQLSNAVGPDHFVACD